MIAPALYMMGDAIKLCKTKGKVVDLEERFNGY
jgi:hypothetical protein